MRKLLVGALVVLTAAACDQGTGLNGGAQVAVQFATDGPTSSASASILGLGTGGVARSIDVSGSNGVLTLDSIHVIVSKFELERADAVQGCESSESAGTSMDTESESESPECEEFQTPPSLLDLSLENDTSTVATAEVSEGTYSSVKFKVEDLEDDEDDPTDAQQISDLRAAVLDQFGEWPDQASMRVKGTFTPDGGDPMPFTAYLAAEIEVELHFDTPFVVTAEDVTREVTVHLTPADWFTRADGTVINLADYDWGTTGMVPEFEVEMGEGFHGVEHDDD